MKELRNERHYTYVRYSNFKSLQLNHVEHLIKKDHIKRKKMLGIVNKVKLRTRMSSRVAQHEMHIQLQNNFTDQFSVVRSEVSYVTVCLFALIAVCGKLVRLNNTRSIRDFPM